MNIDVKHGENILNVGRGCCTAGKVWTLKSFGYIYYLLLANT